jgi:hypothetical protein
MSVIEAARHLGVTTAEVFDRIIRGDIVALVDDSGIKIPTRQLALE